MPEINYAAALPVLRRGRERIAKGWTQFRFAEDEEGFPVISCSPRAVCWCLEGSLNAGVESPADCTGREAINEILSERIGPDFARWNDAPGRTQAEVLALFDRAIAECEEKIHGN